MKLKKQRTQEIIENLEIIEAASEGNSIAKHNELVMLMCKVLKRKTALHKQEL